SKSSPANSGKFFHTTCRGSYYSSMKSLTGFQILQTAQILFYPTLALINLVIAIDLRYRCRSSSSFCIDNSIF
ncbi:hypothetical protein ACU0TX_005214, partial [Escherichia coli]